MNKVKQEVGALGEDVVARYLVGCGFEIISRNYRQKCGEIDLIARKDERIHFVEVKAVKGESKEVSRESYRPEDNVHPRKLKRISKTVQMWLFEKGKNESDNWQFDVATVFLNLRTRRAKLNMLWDLNL